MRRTTSEFRKIVGKDPAKLAELKKAFDDAVAAAEKFVIPNQFSEIAEQNGAVDLNASTGEDSTQYFWSMPSNRLDALGLSGEQPHRAYPVAREFYKERDVDAGGAADEDRLVADGTDGGAVSGYGLCCASVWAQRRGLGERDQPGDRDRGGGVSQEVLCAVEYWLSRWWGDVKASEAMPILEKYFAPIPAGEKPEPMTTIEPKQFAEKTVVIKEATQPFYLEGYHRPDYRDPDDAVLWTRSRIFFRMDARRGCIAAWCGISRLPQKLRLQRVSGGEVSGVVCGVCGTAAGPYSGPDARRHP